MANLFFNLPVPAGNGVGAPVDTSAMGGEKTITVQDEFGGTVNIEISEDGGATWAQVVTFAATGKRVRHFASQLVRVRRTGVGAINPGLPNIDISANDAGAQFVLLPSGVSVDTSALGNSKTVIVQNQVPGSTINIQVSDDNIRWATCMTFKASDVQFKDFTARFMRAMGANAAISVGAINNAAPDQDELVKVSPDDTTAGYLDQKLVAGSGIALATLNPAGDEDVEISVSGADAGNIETGAPITVRGAINDEGTSLNLARADHEHRLELQVEDEGVPEGARPTINFVGIGVGAVDNPGLDRVDITIPGTPSDGTVVKRSQYVDSSSQTSSTTYVDGTAGTSVVVPIDGDYWAIWEGEGKNQSAAAFLEIGISVNSLVAIDPDSERRSQGNANDVRAFITTVQLPGLLAGDLIRGLFRRGGPSGSVALDNRHLTIFKVQ